MEHLEKYKNIFDKYGGMMRTKELQKEKIFYPKLQYSGRFQ